MTVTPLPRPGDRPNWGDQLNAAISARPTLAAVKGTIETETTQRTNALVPPLVDDRIAQQPEVVEAAAVRATAVAADPVVAQVMAARDVTPPNLFYPAGVRSLAISVTNGNIIENPLFKGFYLPVEPGETYSISRDAILGSTRFQYGFTTTEPAVGVTAFGGESDAAALKFENITVPATATHMFVGLRITAGLLPRVKIERAPDATQWHPAPREAGATGAADLLAFANVTDHGADPTGQVDSTTAFNAAVESLRARGGGTVYAPRGIYRIDGTITLDFDSVELRGAGRSLTTLDGKNTSPKVIMLGNLGDHENSANWRWGQRLTGFKVTGSTGPGVHLKNSMRWSIFDVEATGNTGHGFHAAEWNWVGKIHDSFFVGNGGSGVLLEGWAYDVTGNHFIDNTQYGISGLDVATFTGNTLEHNTLADLHLNKRAVNAAGNYFEGGRDIPGPTVLITGEAIEFTANSTGASRETIRLEGAKSVSIRNSLRGHSAAQAFIGSRAIYVDENCRDIHIDREKGIVTIHPDAVPHVTWHQEEAVELAPEGEFKALDGNGRPVGASILNPGNVTFTIVDSFAGENEHGKALLVHNTVADHTSITFTVTGLTVGKVYTIAAMVSHEPVGTGWTSPPEVRFYNVASLPQVTGDSNIYASTYNRGPYLITRAFAAPATTFNLALGTPYAGKFRVEYMSMVEGLHTEATYPRKRYRKKLAGTTAQRPASPKVGQTYYDRTINKPVIWNGTAWTDYAGATV